MVSLVWIMLHVFWLLFLMSAVYKRQFLIAQITTKIFFCVCVFLFICQPRSSVDDVLNQLSFVVTLPSPVNVLRKSSSINPMYFLKTNFHTKTSRQTSWTSMLSRGAIRWWCLCLHSSAVRHKFAFFRSCCCFFWPFHYGSQAQSTLFRCLYVQDYNVTTMLRSLR